MASYRWPQDDLDDKAKLPYLLGTHWAGYAGQDVLQSTLWSRAQLERQTLDDAQETVAALARATCPIFHRRRWQLLTFRQSDLNGTQAALLRYGDGAVYGQQASGLVYQYGIPHAIDTFGVPADEALRVVPLLTNRLQQPSLVWFDGIDYYLDPDRQVLFFRENPFENALVPKREVYVDGEITDYEIGFWVCGAQFDTRLLDSHWGYLLKLQNESSEAYRALLNGALDAIVQGTAHGHIQRVLQAVTDIELAASDGEVVEVIRTTAAELLVITDQRVYHYHPDAEALVAVGDVLAAGQPLVTALQIYEFNRGQVPESLRFLSMGRGFLGAGYYDGITFENKTVPLEVTTDDAGYTRIEFEVGGFPLDVEKFWDDLHAAGVAAGQTLANLLDQRTDTTEYVEACDLTLTTNAISGQPGADSLPATINPLQFLIQNVLRNNAFVVHLKMEQQGPRALSLANLRVLRRLVPPHTALIILEELTLQEPTVILDEPATETAAGVSESLSMGRGGSLSETLLADDYVTRERVSLRYVSGSCV